jgi:hypothetical protein
VSESGVYVEVVRLDGAGRDWFRLGALPAAGDVVSIDTERLRGHFVVVRCLFPATQEVEASPVKVLVREAPEGYAAKLDDVADG